MALSGRIDIRAIFEESDALALGQRSFTPRLANTTVFVDGAGEGQAEKVYTGAYTAVPATTDTDLDLSGTLPGAFGPVVFAAVKALLVSASPANPGKITVFGGSNPFLAGLTGTTPAVELQPGNAFVLTCADADGWEVTDGANDTLRIATGSASGDYSFDVLVVGA